MGVISVVDDDAEVRSATVDLLNSVGFCCEAYESAEDLFGRATGYAHRLPHPGPQYAGAERAGAAAAARAIGSFHSDHLHHGVSRGADAGSSHRHRFLCYLAKPYSDGELLECVRTALARRDRIIRPEDHGSSQ
jgi:CheY-like chemotaxis protein